MTTERTPALVERLEAMADEFAKVRPHIGSDGPTEALLREAAQALRSQPSVEEVARVIYEAGCHNTPPTYPWEAMSEMDRDYHRQVADRFLQALAVIPTQGGEGQ